MSLHDWTGAARPTKSIFDGRYCRLEPLDASRHGRELHEAATAAGKEERFRYLFESAPKNLEDSQRWAEKSSASDDPLFFWVIDRSTGRADGGIASCGLIQATA